MYHDFFGLNDAPFKITPNLNLFYSGGQRGAILEALLYAVTSGEGIIKVTGEVGSGKTMLCRMLEERLPENVESIFLANPSISRDQIQCAIGDELGLNLHDLRPAQVLRALQEHLIYKYSQGKHVVLFIDEAQSMPVETFEEIRLLSNLETGDRKLLQIVLFGQPEFDDNLKNKSIRQLRERITHSFYLGSFKRQHVKEYLSFRLRAVGYRGPELFSPITIRFITWASKGLLRRINILADKSMLAAFSENTHTIKPAHVMAAIRDSELYSLFPPWRFAAAFLALLLIGISSFFILSQVRDPLAGGSSDKAVLVTTGTTGNEVANSQPQALVSGLTRQPGASAATVSERPALAKPQAVMPNEARQLLPASSSAVLQSNSTGSADQQEDSAASAILAAPVVSQVEKTQVGKGDDVTVQTQEPGDDEKDKQ